MEKRKILVVDDERDVLEILKMRLSHEEYFVITADNGKEAIKLAKTEHPDLILLDLVMPEMDGSEVAEVLRNDPATRDIPVMFLTCLFSKNDETVEGHLIGDQIFFAKPYKPEELLSEIKRQFLLGN